VTGSREQAAKITPGRAGSHHAYAHANLQTPNEPTVGGAASTENPLTGPLSAPRTDVGRLAHISLQLQTATATDSPLWLLEAARPI
jgi:hypothetical protein